VNEYGLHNGNVALESVGALTFGPAGISFIADSRRATTVAVDVADARPAGTVRSTQLGHYSDHIPYRT